MCQVGAIVSAPSSLFNLRPLLARPFLCGLAEPDKFPARRLSFWEIEPSGRSCDTPQPRSLCHGLAAPVAIAALAPINARPLQRLRHRPLILFKLPTVYQPIPVSVLGGHVGEGIALSEVDSGRRWLRRAVRKHLRRSRADDGYGCSSGDADQKMPHSSALGLTLALSEHRNAPVVAEKKNPQWRRARQKARRPELGSNGTATLS
jgi:hypothetical protein